MYLTQESKDVLLQRTQEERRQREVSRINNSFFLSFRIPYYLQTEGIKCAFCVMCVLISCEIVRVRLCDLALKCAQLSCDMWRATDVAVCKCVLSNTDRSIAAAMLILCQITSFFPIVDMCLSCEDIAWQSFVMVPRWRLLGNFLSPAFPASCAQHVSDLHSKFALRPHHV